MVTPMAPTVLDRLVDEIRSTNGPMQLDVLARRVGVQPTRHGLRVGDQMIGLRQKLVAQFKRRQPQIKTQ